jgi:hypothetical protein
MIVLLGAFPWLAQIFFSYPFKSLLPSDKDTVGMGKLMGFVLSHPPSSRTAWSDLYLSHRIAKEVAAERFRPNKKEERDMLGSFIRHGLTQREAQSELLLQM